MKGFRIIHIITTLILTSFVAIDVRGQQQWSDVNKDVLSKTLADVNNHFARMLNYKVSITDESFTSYTATEYHEKYSGYFKRNGESFHSNLGGINTLQNKDYRVAIDSAKRMVMISDPVDYLDKVLPTGNYTELLKSCTKTLAYHSGNVDAYRLEFAAGSPIAAYEITLKDSLPQKIVIYYSRSVKAAHEKDIDKPKLEVYYSNWVTGITLSKEEFSAEKYISKQGNNYVLTPPYSVKYKLLDERVLTRTDKK